MKTQFLFIIFCLLSIHQAVAQIAITWPTHSQVFQRNSNGSANIRVMGQLFTCNATISYRLLNLDPKTNNIAAYGNWTTLSNVQIASSGLFKIELALNTGWYRVELSTDQSNIYSVTFGVGDVYVIAGQSNAQGVNTTLYNLNGYPSVVSVNSQFFCQPQIGYPRFSQLCQTCKISPTGNNSWCWAVLGNKIVDNSSTPVAFVNSAAGGSTVENWATSSSGSSTNSYYSFIQYCQEPSNPSRPDSYYYGQPYTGLKNSLQYYASMFGVRAVLWHQGEANTDRTSSITASQYSSYLNTVISQSRADFNNNLAWFISLASRTRISGTSTIATNDNVLSGQYNQAQLNNNGPYTDNITTRDPSDDTHIYANGLNELGQDWYSQITSLPATVSSSTWSVNLSNLSNGSPSVPNVAPYLSSSGGQIFAPGGYDEYKWVYDENDINSTFASTSYISSPVNFKNYRCYMRQGTQWVLSNKVLWPLGYNTCNSRQGNLDFETEKDPNFKATIFPNPLNKEGTIRFELPNESFVELEITDLEGHVLKKLTKNNHAAGTYKYPFRIEQTGVYIYKLNVNGIGITKRFVVN